VVCNDRFHLTDSTLLIPPCGFHPIDPIPFLTPPSPKISDIESIEPETIIDIIGVVISISPVSSITSKKTGNELLKCELTVLDDSNAEIRITLWGEKAKKAENEFDGCPVVAFKSVKVSDYGGRSLGSLNSSSIAVKPKTPETEVIKTWFDNQGTNAASTRKTMSGAGGGGNRDSFENRKYVSFIKDSSLGYNEKPDWLSFKGTISFIKKDKEGGPWYPACPNKEEPCRNMCKVTQTSDNQWVCERCSKQYPDCCRRYIYSLTCVDDTSCTWATAFNDQAELMLGGITANEMNQYLENGDSQKFEEIFQEALFTDWIFKCKVKNEMVNDEQRVKTTIYGMQKVDYVEESKNLLKAIAGF
jgi:replication factor A1